ncbi:hypothetical protein K1T71_003706 [Dendrolimus kikuchii]|uniref:Uncharacterized protein n=1 Tax=Dendrolimus kikuchii TaxID=765133 RepID=A0ACC1D8T6_9NEOP|nr:hypothetical protein K1T71_003706 [Dendrolimus kikuchii]
MSLALLSLPLFCCQNVVASQSCKVILFVGASSLSPGQLGDLHSLINRFNISRKRLQCTADYSSNSSGRTALGCA